MEEGGLFHVRKLKSGTFRAKCGQSVVYRNVTVFDPAGRLVRELPVTICLTRTTTPLSKRSWLNFETMPEELGESVTHPE